MGVEEEAGSLVGVDSGRRLDLRRHCRWAVHDKREVLRRAHEVALSALMVALFLCNLMVVPEVAQVSYHIILLKKLSLTSWNLGKSGFLETGGLAPFISFSSLCDHTISLINRRSIMYPTVVQGKEAEYSDDSGSQVQQRCSQ